MRRRDVLGGLSGAVALTGCTGVGTDRSPRVGLGRITLANETNDPVPLAVAVEREGDRVLETRFSLEGRREIVEEWMGDTVHYSVSVRVPDDPRESEVTTARLESLVDEWNDVECFELGFSVDAEKIAPYVGTEDACP